jgi:hypothetical protein
MCLPVNACTECKKGRAVFAVIRVDDWIDETDELEYSIRAIDAIRSLLQKVF